MHRWSFCDLCQTWMVVCGKCGNNSCNAGYGEVDGVKCDACPSAYEMQNQPISADVLVGELQTILDRKSKTLDIIEEQHRVAETDWEDDDPRRGESRRLHRETEILEAVIVRLGGIADV